MIPEQSGWLSRCGRFQQAQLLANLQFVGAAVGDSVGQSGDVALGGSSLESVQKQREIALACPGGLNRRIRRSRTLVD